MNIVHIFKFFFAFFPDQLLNFFSKNSNYYCINKENKRNTYPSDAYRFQFILTFLLAKNSFFFPVIFPLRLKNNDPSMNKRLQIRIIKLSIIINYHLSIIVNNFKC